jgi:TPP-dependent pyruvate/acetoin dehydrogenase alpha subunit
MSRATRDKVEIYRRMLLIRRFEEVVIEQHAAGMISGALHCGIGQEAAIVGACMALRHDDYVVPSFGALELARRVRTSATAMSAAPTAPGQSPRRA